MPKQTWSVSSVELLVLDMVNVFAGGPERGVVEVE
jgi:hypothetical protein